MKPKLVSTSTYWDFKTKSWLRKTVWSDGLVQIGKAMQHEIDEEKAFLRVMGKLSLKAAIVISGIYLFVRIF